MSWLAIGSMIRNLGRRLARKSATIPANRTRLDRGEGPFLSERMGVFMIEALPIGPDGIHRAAEEMIAEHGPDALTTAKKRALVLRAEGFESLAKTWDLIYAVLQDVDD